MIFRLQLDMEIDTAQHSMRVIEQHVAEGVPSTPVAPVVWPLCAIAGCGKQTAKITGKYCGREHFGRARREATSLNGSTPRSPRRAVVVDALTGVLSHGQPRVIEHAPIPSQARQDYSAFTFPQL